MADKITKRESDTGIRTEEKTNIQNSIGRLALSTLSFLVQISWLVFLGIKLRNYSVQINTATGVLALILAVWVFNRRDTNSNFKMAWIMLILAFPILGICLFVLFGHKYSQKARERMDKVHGVYSTLAKKDESILKKIKEENPGVGTQFDYIFNREGFPVYNNSKVEFFKDASDGFKSIKESARNAKEFIYMEYFAIQDSSSFGELYDILLEKVSQGVEVRILYDDIGSIGFLNNKFAKKLEEKGIHCRAFNKVSPAFRLYMNNRDHRKIAVFDGEVAYTGGFNIANEYFNVTHPFGYWKDTGIKIEGEAVNSLLAMFLEMWNIPEKELEDVSPYRDKKFDIKEETGYIAPFADSPLDDARVGENAYINIISLAKKSLYITTPYLVISDELQRALQLAAMRGVDVRIVTPGIPDKVVTYKLTRSYYPSLIKCGVKIYEYTPGFIHCKETVADSETAIIGTINYDYRSLVHHFENAVLMYNTDAVKDISKDFEEMFEVSRLVNDTDVVKVTWARRIVGAVLRLIAPLI